MPRLEAVTGPTGDGAYPGETRAAEAGPPARRVARPAVAALR